MTRKGLVVLAGLGMAVLGPLSGCTVAVAGVTGITVTEDGAPLGVMLVCHDHIDGATLYDSGADSDYDPDEDEPSEPDDLGTWSRRKPATGFTVWSLRTGGRGWSADTPVAALDPHRTYSLYGWTHDNSWSTIDVTFTAAQLARLEPGQVRYYKGEGAGTDRDGYATVSMDTFRSEGCLGE
jgi:hypothetical protein